MDEPAIDVMPFFHGRLPRVDLLDARKSFIAWISLRGLSEGRIIGMQAEGFSLEAGIVEGSLVLRRNGYVVRRPLAPYTEANIPRHAPPVSPCHIGFTWSPTELAVYVNARPSRVQTPPTFPPNSLLDWARRQAILPVKEYESERALADTVLNGLAGLEDKIVTTGMQPAFWDFTYDGKRIVSRQPKKEPQVHPTIHGLLHDLALAKNITVHPEAAAGPGRLDFLLTGPLKRGKIAKVCIEFKHAHSDDAIYGLIDQLPEYMSTHAADSGFYCLPWYKGAYFDRPKEDIRVFRGVLVAKKAKLGLDNVGLILIDVSGGVPLSRKKEVQTTNDAAQLQ